MIAAFDREDLMPGDSSPTWIYNQTVKMFAAGASPAFEDAGELGSVAAGIDPQSATGRARTGRPVCSITRLASP
jgi:hypothetical protein